MLRVASATGWILLALGITVPFGWAFHILPVTSVVPGLATMKPNTAIAFLLAGLALLRRSHRDSFYYALGVFTIGAVTLAEYVSNCDFGIDQLLHRDGNSGIDPGRMSQITSVGFILLGPALGLMKIPSQAGHRVSRGLGLATGALGFIALLGYSYDTQALYQVRPYSSIALHTAIAFVIAGIGVQCAYPKEGLLRHIHADSAGGAMLRRLLPAALLIPYLLGFAAWMAHKHLGWEMGFSVALVVAGTIFCLLVIMLFNAKRLEREDLSRRETNRSLTQRTALLELREELLRTFIKYVPAAVAMFDRDMHYLQASDRWCSEFSLDSSQIVGSSHYEDLPDIPERWKEFHHRGLAGETLNAEEDRWDRIDGSTVWLRWEIRPWGSADGLPEGILIFSEDITGHKQAEIALRDSEQQLRVLAGSLLTAQEDERRRLSRELHDDITQRLAFLSIELGKLAAEIPDSFESTRATIRTLQDQTRQTSTEVRRLSRGLHPSVIEDFGLSIALEEFCSEFEKAERVNVSFEGLVGDPRLDNPLATCLYRIAQESLRNAVTHGHATEIRVTLNARPESMQLRVADNGVGFFSESARTKTGLGVVSMRERIRLVNGTLTLSSQPGRGTEVVATVPLVGVRHEKTAHSSG